VGSDGGQGPRHRAASPPCVPPRQDYERTCRNRKHAGLSVAWCNWSAPVTGTVRLEPVDGQPGVLVEVGERRVEVIHCTDDHALRVRDPGTDACRTPLLFHRGRYGLATGAEEDR
jgi:hypothetical protein